MEEIATTVSLKKSAGRVGFAAVILLVSQQLVATIASIILYKVYPVFFSQSYAMWFLSYLPLYLVGVPLFVLTVKGLANTAAKKEKIDMPAGTFIKWWFISMAAMYIFNIVSVLINMAISAAKGGEVINPIAEMQQGSGIIYNIIFGVIVAPVGEELLFRHILYKKLSGFGDKVFIFISAFVFACIHGNLSQLLYAFVLGAIFAYIMARTRNVIYCILMHVIVNALGMIVGPLCLGSEIAMSVYSTLLLATVIFGVILFMRTRKKGFIFDEPTADTPKKPIKAAMTSAGMIAISVLCLAFCVYVILV